MQSGSPRASVELNSADDAHPPERWEGAQQTSQLNTFADHAAVGDWIICVAMDDDVCALGGAFRSHNGRGAEDGL